MSVNKEVCGDFKSMPSLLSIYRKILFVRKPGWDEKLPPQIKVSCANVGLSADKVRRYAKVCGFAFDGQVLPITYLHVMIFRLHAAIFTNPAITFPLMGIIHLGNRISQYRPLRVKEPLDIECSLDNSKATDAGLELNFVAKVYVGRELVWESLSTYLYRTESAKKRVRPPKASVMVWDNPVRWSLKEALGRQYAKASGDYNFIHLHPKLAKYFGFDRVLVQGMWSKARAVAELMPQIGDRACTIDVAFKLPLFMPSEVTFGVDCSQEGGLMFELRDGKGRRPHLTGNVEFHD